MRRRAPILALLALFVASCSTPIGVKRVDARRVHRTFSASVLSTGKPLSNPHTINEVRCILYERARGE